MVIDTETCDLQGSVYDVGYTICDKHGTVLKSYNALAREVFTDASRMMGAFYAKKMFTHYAPMLDDSLIRLENWQTIVDQMRSDIAAYNVTTIAAYNAGFDLRVMRTTNAQFGDGSPICPKGLKILDIWQFASPNQIPLLYSIYRR